VLLSKADVNQASNLGSTPLYIASECGHKDTVQLLLQSKATPGPLADNNYSLLAAVRAQGHEDIAQLLQCHSTQSVEHKM
jgi:ankyrin repeat protein